MRTLLAVGTVVLVAGCAVNADPSAAHPSRVGRYLEHVRGLVPSAISEPDADLVQFGLANCVLLRNHASLESLFGLAPTGMGKLAVRLVIATSVKELCPEFRPVLNGGSSGVTT
jgi:hypothetical protein